VPLKLNKLIRTTYTNIGISLGATLVRLSLSLLLVVLTDSAFISLIIASVIVFGVHRLGLGGSSLRRGSGRSLLGGFGYRGNLASKGLKSTISLEQHLLVLILKVFGVEDESEVSGTRVDVSLLEVQLIDQCQFP
jgi:hypothetical protein